MTNRKQPMQPVIMDKRKVARFKKNAIIEYLFEERLLDLNKLSMMDFPKDDYNQITQLLGYSVSGYGTLSTANWDHEHRAQQEVERLLGTSSDFKAKQSFKLTVALDFDGVLHSYTTRWTKAEEIHDGPVEGALKAVWSYIDEGIDVCIYSARARSSSGTGAIWDWLEKHEFPTSDLQVTSIKPAASIYVDDRSYLFTGLNFPSPKQVRDFRPWNRAFGWQNKDKE